MSKVNGNDWHIPHEISPAEWQEILQRQDVQNAFEIPPKEPDEKVLTLLFGAKYELMEDDGEIIGYLYVIQNKRLGILPIVFVKSYKMMPVDRDE